MAASLHNGAEQLRRSEVNWKGHGSMKVTVEFDCTPDEARRFMGLPDVEKINGAYLDAMTRTMKGVTSMDQLESYAKQFTPMGQFGLTLFQNFLENTRNAMVFPSADEKTGKKGG